MKTAIVTGASTGIGKATAIELGKRGYGVGIVGRNKERLVETEKLVGQAESFVCDLSDVAQVNSLIQNVRERYKHLDVLINIAGIWHGDNEVYAGKGLESFEQKVVIDTINVGLTAPMLLVHGLVPIMKPGSSIVNLSGTFASGGKGWIPYYASKRALEDLTAGLADELKEKGIKVNCVSPADTATEEYIKYFPEDAKDANSPEQVAKLIADLCEGGESGKFAVIKRGLVSWEGFHS
jgi:NAD(P)-dependent dehydrogenase (short-subunit alcohol dehydrogenase family)